MPPERSLDRGEDRRDSSDLRPVPDPTLLTTQNLQREVGSLKEVIFTRLDAMDKAIALFHTDMTRVPTDTDKQIQHLKELHGSKIAEIEKLFHNSLVRADAERGLVWKVLETRLDGMDKANSVLQVATMQFPTRIDEKISALGGVHDERFRAITVQFHERDVRAEQSSRDSKLAIDAALQAAKEAVAAQNISSANAITKSENAVAKQIDQLGILINSTTKGADDKIDDLKERLTRLEGTGTGEKDANESRFTSGQYTTAIVGAVIAAAGLIIGLLVIFMKP